MQLIRKRRHSAFVVEKRGGEFFRKRDDLCDANALLELFAEGSHQADYSGSLDIGKGIPDAVIRKNMLHTTAVMGGVGTGKRQRILCKLNHLQNAVLGRTKQFFCQPVLANRLNDFPKKLACLCQFFPQYIRNVQRLAADGSAGDCFSLIADTILPVVQRQQIVFGHCACHIAPSCHVFLF